MLLLVSVTSHSRGSVLAEEQARNEPVVAESTPFRGACQTCHLSYACRVVRHTSTPLTTNLKLTQDHGKRGKYGGSLLKSPWEFRQRGESGLWISDIFPNVAQNKPMILTLIRSMQCDQPVHPGAMTQMHTGNGSVHSPLARRLDVVRIGYRER